MDPDDVRGLVSLFLAAGNLVCYRSPGGGRVQATLTGGQRDAAYLEEKVDAYRKHIETQARIIPYHPQGKAYGGSSMILRFRHTSTKLLPIYHLFYPRGKRHITSSVLELCGGNAAAWLLAEHGDRDRQGLVLRSTASTLEEVIRIGQWFTTMTGADLNVQLEGPRKQPVIRMSSEQAAKAADTLSPYAPASRRHFFLLCLNDVIPVCDPSALLLPGQGTSLAPRRKVKVVARNQTP